MTGVRRDIWRWTSVRTQPSPNTNPWVQRARNRRDQCPCTTLIRCSCMFMSCRFVRFSPHRLWSVSLSTAAFCIAISFFGHAFRRWSRWTSFCDNFDTIPLLQNSFDRLALFFCDKYGGDMIGVLWRPAAFQPQTFKVTLKF